MLTAPVRFRWTALSLSCIFVWLFWELGSFGVWFAASIFEVIAAVLLVNSSFSLADIHLMTIHKLADECAYVSRLIRAEFVLCVVQSVALWGALDPSLVLSYALGLVVAADLWAYIFRPEWRCVDVEDAWKTAPGVVRTLRWKVCLHVVLLVVLMLVIGPRLPSGPADQAMLSEEVET